MNYQGRPDRQQIAGRFSGLVTSALAALLFMASISTFAQSPEIRKAYQYLEIEQPSKFMPALQKAVGDNPDNQYYLGLGYILTGDLDKALEIFEKGIADDRKNPLPVAGKGHVKLLQKKHAEGKALLAEAADMNRKKTAEQWKAIGRAYLSDTKFLLDAISALENAKQIDNGDPMTHVLLGDAYLLQNDGGKSVSSYERAVSADPNWATPLFKIAKVYQRSNNDEIVMNNLTRAVKVEPQYAPAWKELGEIYYKEKKPSEAVDAYEKYLSITENPGDARYQLGFFYMMDKNYQKATEIFGEVLKDRNASPTALKFYSFALMEQGKDEEAEKILGQFFETAESKDIKASDYATYGKLLLKLKKDSLANEVFAKGIELDTAFQEMEIRELHAKTYYDRKKYDKAVEAYEELIEAKKKAEMPPSAYDMFYLGHANYVNGDYIEADSAFTTLSEMQPNSTLGYLYAAKARAQHDSTGTSGVAIPMYEKFVEIALEDPEKNKKELIDAYDYLGQFALHKSNDLTAATSYFRKILELDPNNQRAKDFMDAVKQMNNPTRGKGR